MVSTFGKGSFFMPLDDTAYLRDDEAWQRYGDLLAAIEEKLQLYGGWETDSETNRVHDALLVLRDVVILLGERLKRIEAYNYHG
jgi:hypothetical protein